MGQVPLLRSTAEIMNGSFFLIYSSFILRIFVIGSSSVFPFFFFLSNHQHLNSKRTQKKRNEMNDTFSLSLAKIRKSGKLSSNLRRGPEFGTEMLLCKRGSFFLGSSSVCFRSLMNRPPRFRSAFSSLWKPSLLRFFDLSICPLNNPNPNQIIMPERSWVD